MTGGCGKFSKLYGVVFALSYGTVALFAYNFAFMEKIPEFVSFNGDIWESCKVETVCEIREAHSTSHGYISYKVDEESKNSIWNWMTQFNLYCEEDEYAVGIFGSTFFFGFLIGAAILLRLADIYGRKTMGLISLFFSFLFLVGLSMSDSIEMTYFLLFANGFFIAGRCGIFYILMMESIPEASSKTFGVIA
jgi:MFS family permease